LITEYRSHHQESDFSYQNLGLTHHLSLPTSSTKMSSSIEKFLEVQGSVPCKIRAKRGFATHPRSIAERVKNSITSSSYKFLLSLSLFISTRPCNLPVSCLYPQR